LGACAYGVSREDRRGPSLRGGSAASAGQDVEGRSGNGPVRGRVEAELLDLTAQREQIRSVGRDRLRGARGETKGGLSGQLPHPAARLGGSRIARDDRRLLGLGLQEFQLRDLARGGDEDADAFP